VVNRGILCVGVLSSNIVYRRMIKDRTEKRKDIEIIVYANAGFT